MSKKLKICIDFDGTCVAHEFPKVGENIGSIPILKKLVEKGHKLILFTMRSNSEIIGSVLDDAVNWFKKNNIPLYGIQFDPEQDKWTTSPKAYGNLYIDDAALGTPLLQKFKSIHGGETIFSCCLEHIGTKQIKELIGKPYVNWEKIEVLLKERNIL